MTKVFIGGSRQISRLNADVRARLDRIMGQGFSVLVGDANGADKAVQKHLDDKGYRNVEVFCSGTNCRNNIGGWPLRSIKVEGHKTGRAFYTAKDRAMTDEATIGFMLWDGKSLGTLSNVARLLRQGKVTVVYNAPERRFEEIKTADDWRTLLAGCPRDLRQRAEKEAEVAVATARAPAQASLW